MRIRRTTLGALAITLCAGCSTTLEDLPLPSPGLGADSYTVDAVFTDALNLPHKAKVKLGGVDIGEVKSIDAIDFTARVSMNIRSDVALPADVRAELRQATPLGDVFVALSSATSPSTPAGTLEPGSTIDLDDTSAGASVEELLASASLMVNGGGLSKIQTIIGELDQALTGRSADVSTLITELTETVTALNDRSAEIESVLLQASDVSTMLNARSADIDRIARGLPPLTRTLADNSRQMSDVIVAAGGVAGDLDTFTGETGPALRGLIVGTQQVLADVASMGDDLDVTMKQLAELEPKLTTNTQGNAAAIYVRLSWLSLSALDDPASNWPGARDVEDFVGSVSDTLNRVYGRVTGQGLTPQPTVVPPSREGTPPNEPAEDGE